jgi:hypothetical protein
MEDHAAFLRALDAEPTKELVALMKLTLIPNAKTIEAMKEARRGSLKSFSSIADLMADINAL